MFLRFEKKLKWKQWDITTTCTWNVMFYGLCPSLYSRQPALSWNAMLNMAKVELDLISDAEIHLFFEKGIGSGVSYSSKRSSIWPKTRTKTYYILRRKWFIWICNVYISSNKQVQIDRR